MNPKQPQPSHPHPQPQPQHAETQQVREINLNSTLINHKHFNTMYCCMYMILTLFYMDFVHSHPLRYPSRLRHFFHKSFHCGLERDDVIYVIDEGVL